jgi:hypothetical protein
MKDVLRALGRGIGSQLQPALLGLTLAPLIIGAVLAWAFLWATWDPLTASLRDWMGQAQWISSFNALVGIVGLELKIFLVPVLALAIYLLLAVLFSLVLVTCLAMPLIVRRIAQGDYGDVERRFGGSWWGSVMNSLVITIIVGIGWLLFLPFYLIPPLGFLIPWLWWTFAFNRILRYDALVEHATAEERAALFREHKGRLFILAAILALFNWLPFAWFALPVFSGIVFTHYCLHALRALRARGATGSAT